jgi:uncharacterized protein
VPIKNKTAGSDLPYIVISAETLLSRMTGLLGTDFLDNRTSVYFVPCKSIHTFGMRSPIDILFLNQENKLIKLLKNFPPNRLTGIIPAAHSVLEFSGGAFKGAELNDLLEVKQDKLLSINKKGVIRLLFWPVIIFVTALLCLLVISSFSN